ncbi:hypothetical protein CNR22_17145 [Sphingobacteriaceae bacterium]|nr:hypothetical protein CNR22_17145 [Sphingobacteriaceae bacterium]
MFEGEVIYSNTFKSKNPKLKEKELSAMMGSIHNYYVKNGDYKTVTNGAFAQWQLYIQKDNKLYNKMVSSDTLFYNDGLDYDDEVLSTKLNKNVTTILGYPCDELILTCKSGVQKYYFNSKLKIDSRYFVNHKYGNYYNYISKTNAVPLKMIIEDYDFIMESVATKVEQKKLPVTVFQLPVNSKVAKFQY